MAHNEKLTGTLPMPMNLQGVMVDDVVHDCVLFYTEDTHDKFYRVTIYTCRKRGFALFTHWGRRRNWNSPNEVQSKLQGCYSLLHWLRDDAETLLRGKIDRGYTHELSGRPRTGNIVQAMSVFIEDHRSRNNPAFPAPIIPPIATVANWTLPEIMGGRWHRNDFTEEMLPARYRPLLVSEMPQEGDELSVDARAWSKQYGVALTMAADGTQVHQRTQRSLPSGVTYTHARGGACTLPPAPEGHQWQFADTWTEDMLPVGYRPLLVNEVDVKGDETTGCSDQTNIWKTLALAGQHVKSHPEWGRRRTKRPLPDGLTLGFLPTDSALKKRRRALEL